MQKTAVKDYRSSYLSSLVKYAGISEVTVFVCKTS